MARKKRSGKRKHRILHYSKGRRTRSGRRGSGSIRLSVAGVKKALGGGAPVLFTAGGAVAARAAYGLLGKYAPTMDAKLRAALSVIGTIAGGMLISHKARTVAPLAIGAAVIGLVDLLSDELGNSLAASQPEMAQAIALGMKGQAALPAAAVVPLTAGALPSPDVNAEVSGYYPDQFGVGEPDQYGFGDVDMVYY